MGQFEESQQTVLFGAGPIAEAHSKIARDNGHTEIADILHRVSLDLAKVEKYGKPDGETGRIDYTLPHPQAVVNTQTVTTVTAPEDVNKQPTSVPLEAGPQPYGVPGSQEEVANQIKDENKRAVSNPLDTVTTAPDAKGSDEDVLKAAGEETYIPDSDNKKTSALKKANNASL